MTKKTRKAPAKGAERMERELAVADARRVAMCGFVAVLTALQEGQPVFTGTTAKYIGEQMVAAGRELMRQ